MSTPATRFWTCLLCLLLFGAPLGAQDVGAPEEAAPELASARAPIEDLYAVLLDVMKRADELGFQGRYDAIAPTVSESYDLAYMSVLTLGRSSFKQLDEEQRREWAELFRRLTISTFADRFDGFAGEKFEILEVTEGKRATAVVRTRIVPPEDEPVDLNYRLRASSGEWKVFDIFLSGTVSEIALRRSEYSAVLKRDGYQALTAAIQEKIAEARAGTAEDEA